MLGNNSPTNELIDSFFKRLEDHMVTAIQRANAVSAQENHPSVSARGNEKQLMTVKEVADLLSISVSTVYHWVVADRLPYARIGRYLRFDRSEIKVWASSRKGTRKQ